MENADSERLEGKPNGWGEEEERERTETGIRNRPPFQTRPGKYAVRAHPSLRHCLAAKRLALMRGAQRIAFAVCAPIAQ